MGFTLPPEVNEILKSYSKDATLKSNPHWGIFATQDGVYCTLHWSKSDSEGQPDIEFSFSGKVANGGSFVTNKSNSKLREPFQEQFISKGQPPVCSIICCKCGKPYESNETHECLTELKTVEVVKPADVYLDGFQQHVYMPYLTTTSVPQGDYWSPKNGNVRVLRNTFFEPKKMIIASKS